MKYLAFALFFLFLTSIHPAFSQEQIVTPERTAEYEAARQTEKMHQELKLSPEQARQAYEINLKYARARKESTNRKDAIVRLKEKEDEITKILNNNQREMLQNKRYERSSFQPNDNKSNTQTEPKQTDNAQRPSIHPSTNRQTGTIQNNQRQETSKTRTSNQQLNRPSSSFQRESSIPQATRSAESNTHKTNRK